MKVYGKPPLPPPSGKPPKLTRPTGRPATDGGGERQRATSLADISLSSSSTRPLTDSGHSGVDSWRKQSAPVLLASGVKAKVIHQPKPKPRSASSIATRKSSVSSSASGSVRGLQEQRSVTSSLNSTPTHQSCPQPKGRMATSAGTIRSSESSKFLLPSYMALEFCEEGETLSLDPPPQSFQDDEFLLSKSDELCREVMSLCRGDQRMLSSGFISCPKYDGSGDGFDLDLSGELLTSLPCLSLVSSMEATPVPTARTTPPPAHASRTGNPARLEDSGEIAPPKSPTSPEYDYKKVFGILRMIEEEEAKGSEITSCFGEFLREKVAGGGRTSPAGSCQSSRTLELEGSSRREEGISAVNPVKGTRDLEGVKGQLFSTVSSPLPERSSNYCQSLTGTASPFQSSRPENVRGFMETRNPQAHGGEGSFMRSDAASAEWDDGDKHPVSSRSSLISEPWETTDGKTKNLFSFLDQVEQSDRDFLFSLKFDNESPTRLPCSQDRAHRNDGGAHRGPPLSKPSAGELTTASKLDTLIRKGSAELAREIMMLERQVEDSAQNIHVLEETLLSQRELNIRNIKNSEKEMKKRLKLQQEEFELTLTRHQAFLDQIINEKRALQEKCEKVLKESKVAEEKFQGQIKTLQEKHLEEIKRLRKVQENAEKNKKHQWVGQKTQEIRDMTVKGLEPEVQRLIQRHQQEMAETRAYYADEIQEIEERYARKQTQQLQELRENFHREKEESVRRERDLLQKRFESELQRQAEDFETQKRRLVKEAQEDKERLGLEEIKIRETAQENVRKGQIKCEVEVDNLRQEWEAKMSNAEKRHEKEIQSLRDNFESQRENWILTFNKKNEQILQDRESRLIETLNLEKEKEGREREKKVKEDYERIRKEEENVQESRTKRLQEKFQSELEELERSERELKAKFSSLKAEFIGKEEELFSFRTTLGLKTKENQELSESNFKMAEERIHLTSIIRREFAGQIESLEEDCRAVKTAVVELQAKHKLDLESHHLDLEKLRREKDAEIEKIGIRVKQMLGRKEEMLTEVGKQLEKSSIRVNHLENLLEEQRKNFVKSVTADVKTKKK